MWNPKHKTNNPAKLKHTHRYREQTDCFQRGRGLEGWVKRSEGIKKYKLAVIKQSWDVSCSTGNIVRSIVITVYGAWGILDWSGGSL